MCSKFIDMFVLFGFIQAMHSGEDFEPGFNAPDPFYVLEAAQAEPSRKPLQAYMDAIVVLRDHKGFSFREIADWLSENAVKTDHNTVYREYRKHRKKVMEAELGMVNPDEAEETAED